MFYNEVKRAFLLAIFCWLSFNSVAANRIDTQRPDAPELAAYGKYAIGVRTLNVTHSKQIDIVNYDPNEPENIPLYDRPLILEVWYPASANSDGNTTLDVYLRDGKTVVSVEGKAIRNATPVKTTQQFPLVLISHGYPGNRYLLSHLAENIASKGFVVASIEHTDSTYRAKETFASTLLNRPLDQQFTLDQITQLSQDNSSFLFGLVDTLNTALIGYSMGGYGAVISAGGGVTQQAVDYPWGLPKNALTIYQNSVKTPLYPDPRLKTVIAIAPWGMNYGVWDEATLKGVSVPMMFIAGSVDDVSGYDKGIRSIWKSTTAIDRALLTFLNAGHSAGAPMPAPQESFVYDHTLGFNISDHYTDAVWDTVRMNNISQHFVTAWLQKYLKNNAAMEPYLNLVVNSNDGVWSKDENGNNKKEHNHWLGFAKGTAKGLTFEKLSRGE